MAYTSYEEQEINELKSWWKDNGKTVIISAVIAFSGVFGWRYWQGYQQDKMYANSYAYEQALSQYQQMPEAGHNAVADFVNKHQSSDYATFALLQQAKIAVESKDFVLAETALNQAVNQGVDDTLINIANLRLSQVQYEQNKLDEAIATLNKVKEPSLAARKALILGDIYLAKGEKDAAREQYNQGLQSISSLEQQWAKMRLNNL